MFLDFLNNLIIFSSTFFFVDILHVLLDHFWNCNYQAYPLILLLSFIFLNLHISINFLLFFHFSFFHSIKLMFLYIWFINFAIKIIIFLENHYNFFSKTLDYIAELCYQHTFHSFFKNFHHFLSSIYIFFCLIDLLLYYELDLLNI